MSDWVKWASDTASYAKQAASQASVLVAGTELDKKLAEATTNEPWGASSTLLSEIARATFGYDDFKTVMTQIWKNLQLTGSLWRVVYKTLNMLDYILRHGSERVIEDTIMASFKGCGAYRRFVEEVFPVVPVTPTGRDSY